MQTTVQQRMTARLLRRALEAALSPKNPLGVVDAVAVRVTDALPRDRPADLLLWDTEVDALLPARDRRRPRYPCLRRFDPYRDLFTFSRVATQPWDTAWRNTPLVLRDVYLLHAVDFPPFLEAEPHDQAKNLIKIIENHPGPVDSLRVDASRLPSPEMMGRWLDLLSARAVTELVMLDVAVPNKAPMEFPLGRLRCPGLARLALGFVTVRFSWCSGLSGLEELFLVACRCSARDLSEAVANLDRLQTLAIFAVDLAAAGAGAAAAASGDGRLDISSDSLSSLELMEVTVTALTLSHASGLKNLVAGVVPPEVKKHRIWPMTERARPPVRICLRHTPELQTIGGLVLWLQTISVVSPLSKLETLKAALEMAVAEQWSQLLNVVAQLPRLRCLELRRVDERLGYEELKLEPHPACFQDSLRELRLKDYRAGGAEVSLVTTLLATAAQLICVRLYPQKSLPNPGLAHVDRHFWKCKRLSAAARIEVCQSDWE